ncbi:MAG: hypothetical protein EHM78_06765 [Myxococcaceae bacterium]|nr:MAG: hypothetical protein EHM78_06765 [Myxococcaceae bacterium]
MELLPGVLLILRTVTFIAVCYVGLYIAATGLTKNPENKLLGFFALVASPLLRPARALAGSGASERKVRWVAFALAVGVWVVTVVLDVKFGAPAPR